VLLPGHLPGGGPLTRELSAEQTVPVERRSGPWALSANAGSGKTTVLVERFARAVEEDALEADQILAITFTDKAAGELRQRVRKRFAESGNRAAMRRLESGWITTFHGFCARLLRSYPLHAGIDPAFTVLDEVDAGSIQREAFDEASGTWLDAAAARGEAALDLAAVYRGDGLENAIRGVHAAQRSAGAAAPRLPAARAPGDPAVLRTELERACAAAAADLAGEQSATRVDQARDALSGCAETLATLGPGVLPGALEGKKLLFNAGANALKREPAARYLAAVAAAAEHAVTVAAAEVVPMLDDLLARFGAAYAERKRRLGALDFEDLQLEAVALLRADEALAQALRRRFALVMVDEFQDTNGVQLELLRELVEPPGEATPEGGSLFTVGDPFQSIYGFRHADVTIMQTRREELAVRERALTLATNYRSRRVILDAINTVFAAQFEGETFTALEAGRTDAEDQDDAGAPEPPAGPRVELLVTDSGVWEEPADGEDPTGTLPGPRRWRHAEARLVAQRVRDIVDAGEAEPGDVVVLLRALTDLGAYDRALRETGLATQVTAGRGYWDSAAVRDVVAYLSALANPRDEGRLFELLASPFVGLSPDGLALVALKRRELKRRIWDTLVAAFCGAGSGSKGLAGALDPADAERLGSFCPWFEAERAGAARFALDVLIERAIRDRRADLEILRHPDGERRLANVRKLMRLAREHEEREGRDIRSFLDRVARYEELETREGEAPVEGAGASAVKLMTVHAAKGLEFGVVVLADLGRPPREDHPDLVVSGDRVGVRLRSHDGDPIKALDLEALLTEARAAAEREERRVLYVAMTRARERLILSGGLPLAKWPDPDKRTSPPLAWIAPGLVPDVAARLEAEPDSIATGTFAERDVPVRVALNTPATLGTVLRRESLAPASGLASGASPSSPGGEPDPAVLAPADHEPSIRRGSPVATLSFSGLQAYGKCGYRFYATKVLGLPATDEDARAPGDGVSGRDRGSIVHALLETFDPSQPRVPSPAEAVAVAAGWGVPLTDEEAEEISGTLAGFAASELCARLGRAERLSNEAGFAFALETGERGEPVLINGFVDVLAWEGEHALVIDYKTNLIPDDVPIAQLAEEDYAVQRLVYALAVLRQGAAEVEVVYSYLRRVDEPATRTYRADEMPALEAELAELAGGVVRSEFTVAPVPHRRLCDGCPVRGTLCSHPRELTEREPAEAFGPPPEPEPDPPEDAYDDDLGPLEPGQLF
jgi:ATP-dependent helicase/nuclease subunit A